MQQLNAQQWAMDRADVGPALLWACEPQPRPDKKKKKKVEDPYHLSYHSRRHHEKHARHIGSMINKLRWPGGRINTTRDRKSLVCSRPIDRPVRAVRPRTKELG